MALIIKGEQKIISKDEMEKKISEELEQREDAYDKLTMQQKERRKEIASAKRHREFMLRVQQNAIKDTAMKRSLAKEPITTTSEIIADARAERAKMVTSSSINKNAETPDFTSMTKKEIDLWAEENLGLSLDRRKTKAELIQIIQDNL